MNNFKLNNVISTGENRYIATLTFAELKNLLDFETININPKKEVSYVPLEDEAMIYFNIDKDSLNYDNETKELIVKDKFMVADGEIRLIDFINNFNWYKYKMDQTITLTIACYDAKMLPMEFSENKQRKTASDKKIPINTEAIKEISDKVIVSYELNQEIEKWVSKNNGNGYHRITALVNAYKDLGKTDLEIVKILKNLDK